MDNCIFCRIVKGEIPKDFKYEDDSVVAFDNINPAAPIHLLIVPKEHIDDFFNAKDPKTHMAITLAIHKLIEKTGLMGKGYKIEVNGGGSQEIDHLHFHLFGPTRARK